MAYILLIRNSGGSKTKVMGCKWMVRNVNPYYAIVGFYLHGGGGKVGALNAPWSSLLLGGRSHTPGGSCASMMYN